MKEIMTRIELSGELGRTFGRKHERMIKSTAEAIRSLCCTIDGIEGFLNKSKSKGITYAVFRGNRNIGEFDLNFPVTEGVIRIVPVVIGSKKAGLLQTILGITLVVVASMATTGLAAAFTASAGGWGSMAMLGASMALGGVIQMLSPQMPGLASKQATENKPSYAFGGVTNTAAQGYPVPLLYGKRRIGGAIISAGIYVEDQQ